MAPRSFGSAEISVGTFTVFVKLYPALASARPLTKQVHAGCGAKLEQQQICEADGKRVSKAQIGRAYALPTGETVVFTDEEWKELEPDRSDALDLVEFVPRQTVDAAYLGRLTYLGPDEERGVDGYALLVDALLATGTVALGRHFAKGHEKLVLVEVYGERGLALREVHYPEAVRSFEEIDVPMRDGSAVAEVARRSLIGAIEQRRAATFDVSSHADPFPDRVRAAAERKLETERAGRAGTRPVALHEAARKRLEKGRGERETMPTAAKGPAAVRSLPTAPRVAVGEERPSQSMKTSR